MVTPLRPGHLNGLQTSRTPPIRRSRRKRSELSPSQASRSGPQFSRHFGARPYPSLLDQPWTRFSQEHDVVVGSVNLNTTETVFKRRSHDPSPAASPKTSSKAQPHCDLWLGFQHLSNFDAVTNQFASQGLEFTNTIAIQPSNPAFPLASPDDIVLMGAPKAGLIELSLAYRAARCVGVYVTSSRAVVMVALDAEANVIAQAELQGGNLATEDPNEPSQTSLGAIPPNAYLCVTAPMDRTIAKVVLRSSGGQFVVTRLGIQY